MGNSSKLLKQHLCAAQPPLDVLQIPLTFLAKSLHIDGFFYMVKECQTSSLAGPTPYVMQLWPEMPVISTCNHIYRMYNPIEITSCSQ